jgi:hypothetical protein
VNSAIYTAAAQQGLIAGVDDGVDGQCGNIPLVDFHPRFHD